MSALCAWTDMTDETDRTDGTAQFILTQTASPYADCVAQMALPYAKTKTDVATTSAAQTSPQSVLCQHIAICGKSELNISHEAAKPRRQRVIFTSQKLLFAYFPTCVQDNFSLLFFGEGSKI